MGVYPKLAVACSLALGMLLVDKFVSLEHPVWQVWRFYLCIFDAGTLSNHALP